MRNKFYSCNIKTHVLGFNKHLGKHFQHPAGFGRVFPAKKLSRYWSGSWQARGYMADEAKLCSSVCSAFEALVVWHAVGKELGPFCLPMLAAGVAIFSPSHWFAEHTSQIQWFCQDSVSYSGSDQQQITIEWLWLFFFFLFLVQVWLWVFLMAQTVKNPPVTQETQV